MRVPVSWLREVVEIPAVDTAEDIQAALVRVGLEEEAVHRSELQGPIVVGRVLEFVDEPQSNGKTIRWCQVDVGEGEPRGIVCGAANFDAGDLVVVSLPGAVLPGPFPISARKTYGHVSDGMIASARELGLGDDHDGILRLAVLGLEAAPGTDALALLGLGDTAFEVNVTPDRGYAMSIRGIGREYANSTGAAFRDPALRAEVQRIVEAPVTEPFPLEVADEAPIRGAAGCTVFVTRVVRGIDASRPTPAWMISRLALAGVRSLSLPIDITNYVMIELGQPIHGYDLGRLDGGIVVRRARAGERLTTIDGQDRALHGEDLLITDASGPIGLAGVMGGARTELTTATRDVLIEAARFDPVSIARSARRHKLPSEAAKRFERGVDPLVAEAAAARVAELLVELAGGTLDALGSRLVEAPASAPIHLRDGFVVSLTGADYRDDEVRAALEAIGCTVTAVDGGLDVVPPSWRPDLEDEPTLVEEAARIIGYDRIPSVLPVAPPGRGLSPEQRARRAVAQQLAANGVTEVQAYPFISAAAHERFDGASPAVRLANPLDGEAPLLRRSLLSGLLDITRRNLSRGLVDLALFEVGSVFRPAEGVEYGTDFIPGGTSLPAAEVLDTLNASIPPQSTQLAALFLGDRVLRRPGRAAVPAGLADAIDAARQAAAAVGAPLRVVQGERLGLHPGRTAELFAGEVSLGHAGELHPGIAAELDLPRVVAVLELDLDALITAARPVETTPISGYPAATQDLSLVVGRDVPAAEVLEAVIAGAGALLEHGRLVEDYRGEGVAADAKSLTFSLRFRAADRTLTAAEATESKLAGVAVATERFGASLRE